MNNYLVRNTALKTAITDIEILAQGSILSCAAQIDINFLK